MCRIIMAMFLARTHCRESLKQRPFLPGQHYWYWSACPPGRWVTGSCTKASVNITWPLSCLWLHWWKIISCVWYSSCHMSQQILACRPTISAGQEKHCDQLSLRSDMRIHSVTGGDLLIPQQCLGLPACNGCLLFCRSCGRFLVMPSGMKIELVTNLDWCWSS